MMEDTGDFTINKTTIDCLSSETRLLILTSLRKRRKTNAELAKELSLAPPTVLHHLEILKQANLIMPVENEHKWIYYDLTSFGQALLEPGKKMRVSILLSSILTFAMAAVAGYTYFVMPSLNVRPWIPVAADPFFMLIITAILVAFIQAALLLWVFCAGKR